MHVGRKYITIIAAVITIKVSLFVMIGWYLDIAQFISFLTASISMKFNMAICFLLLGVALLLHNNERARYMGVICSLFVVLTGLLMLSEYLFNVDSAIDRFFWNEPPGDIDIIYPGRPSFFFGDQFYIARFYLA